MARITAKDGKEFVSPAERIAVFDNDGTLWCERPIYVQAAFVLDRIKVLAAQKPVWVDKEPFKSLLAGDKEVLQKIGEKELMEMVMVTHAGTTTDEFTKIVTEWVATAKHPKFDRPYTECVYQPMQEVLAHLRANGFKTFIDSGGGIEFMRPWAEKVYGIPPEQVIGSSIVTKYEERDGKPILVRLPKIDFIDDKDGKPVGIQRHIGRRPIMCFGNSDGDYEMLRWTTAGEGPRFGLIVHHTDADREYSYDRKSHVGTLAKALDDAAHRKWLVADMKTDWKKVFPFEK